MPSGHVAFALLVGWLLARQGRAMILRGAGVAYPVVVTLTVLATANHLWLDALAGVLVAAAGAWLVSLAPVAARTWSRGRWAPSRLPGRIALRPSGSVHGWFTSDASRKIDLFE